MSYHGKHRKPVSHKTSRRAALAATFSLGLSLAAPAGPAQADVIDDALVAVEQAVTVVRETVPGTNGLFEYIQLIQNGEAVGRAIARTGAAVSFLLGTSSDDTMSVEEMVLAPVEPEPHEEQLQWAHDLADIWPALHDFSVATGLGTPGEGDEDAEGGAFQDDIEGLLGEHAGTPVGEAVEGVLAGDDTIQVELTYPMRAAPAIQPEPESEPGYIYDSSCTEITNNSHKAAWRGCYRRYSVDDRDRNAYYSGDESQASGHGTYWYKMPYADTQMIYGQRGGRASVVKWAPSSTLDQGRCKTVTTKLSLETTELSETYDVCPESISPYHDDANFKVVWEGASYGRVVAAVAEDFIRIPNNNHSGFTYKIRRKWCMC